MSADVVIRAKGLGKKYVIGHHARERVPTFRDAIVRNVKEFTRTTGDILRGKPLIAGDELEEFWALKDVSFEIKRGDVVGVIGRNGAGKSTLLKVLSRITEPSQGRVEIKGRVASLLEVGTGFHPELTGRENIFLNGAILGMSRNEIRRKFDEIVAFAEIEKFLDTPVKRYSSGMYVRLAFAVAAHLEPEILIVDEVLAVGDAEFQKKCLGKMQDVAGHGRTVLFVSHNMGAIRELCQSSLLLNRGSVQARGTTSAVIHEYHVAVTSAGNDGAYTAKTGKTLPAQIVHSRLITAQGETVLAIVSGEPLTLLSEYKINRPISDFSIVLFIRNILGPQFIKIESPPYKCDPGPITSVLNLANTPLTPGQYLLSLGIAHKNVAWIEQLEDIILFEVTPNTDANWRMGYDQQDWWVATKHTWSLSNALRKSTHTTPAR